MVENCVKILLADKTIVIGYWDCNMFCWREHPSGKEIKSENVVGFTELNHNFPNK